VAKSPIDQFKIEEIVRLGDIGNVKIAFTNSSLFMMVAVALIFAFLFLATRGRTLVPTRVQSLAELSYEFIAGTVRGAMGHDGMRFFPFIFALFSFVLVCNFLGMIPFFYTVTSQIIVTFALALLVILVVLVVGFAKHGLGFLNLFVPGGVPGFLVPFIVVIEVISFLSRPISLALRLFANMLGGHIALKVFAGFVVSLGGMGVVGWLGALGPLALGIFLTTLEFLIAFLQAYVFALLASIYLNDALHPGHH
jgi:F-type H+-transporting ATPase subunit a